MDREYVWVGPTDRLWVQGVLNHRKLVMKATQVPMCSREIPIKPSNTWWDSIQLPWKTTMNFEQNLMKPPGFSHVSWLNRKHTHTHFLGEHMRKKTEKVPPLGPHPFRIHKRKKPRVAPPRWRWCVAPRPPPWKARQPGKSGSIVADLADLYNL